MAVIVVAPDSFKGTATARAAAAAIADGWRISRPDDELRILPMADGGEGTLDAFEAAVPGSVRHTVRVAGPVVGSDPVDAAWLELGPVAGRRHRVGAVELAAAAGLHLVTVPAPCDAHTSGLGELLRAVVSAGADEILVGLGGSASTDGGAGALRALGAVIVDGDGQLIGDGGAELSRAARVDLGALIPLPPRGVQLLTDVTNPLFGPAGAAAVFGPQKGATADDVGVLDAALTRWAAVLGGDPAAPGVGAAGGTAFGLRAWGAEIRPGAPAIAQAIGLREAVGSADAVITGEGSFDAQTASGKAPGHVLDLAREAGAREFVIAGRVLARAAGVDAVALVDLAGGAVGAMTEPLRWLREAGRILALSFDGESKSKFDLI